jgi:hypothetical protein
LVTESGAKLILWMVAAGLTAAMLGVPQPVDPWEMPSLVLERAAVSDAIALDRSLAKEEPDSNEVRMLRSLFLDHGRSEANPPYTMMDYDQRQAEIHRATRRVIETHGEAALPAMRSSAVETFVDVFGDGTRELDGDDIAVVGGMPEVLEGYGAVRDGVIVAPPLTLRAFYKARWNSVHRRPFVEGFSDIELQAYWGWLALHGWGKPIDQRTEALVAFRDAGGFGTDEAAALFDLLGGRPEQATESLLGLYETERELRLRNLALGTQYVSQSQPGAE